MYAYETKNSSELLIINEYLLSIKRIDTANAQQVVVDFAPTQL